LVSDYLHCKTYTSYTAFRLSRDDNDGLKEWHHNNVLDDNRDMKPYVKPHSLLIILDSDELYDLTHTTASNITKLVPSKPADSKPITNLPFMVIFTGIDINKEDLKELLRACVPPVSSSVPPVSSSVPPVSSSVSLVSLSVPP